MLIQPGEGARCETGRFLDYLDLRSQVKSITELAAFELSSMNVSDSAGRRRCTAARVFRPAHFETMGPPRIGRGFTAQDFTVPVVVLSDTIWQDALRARRVHHRPRPARRRRGANRDRRDAAGRAIPERRRSWVPLDPPSCAIRFCSAGWRKEWKSRRRAPNSKAIAQQNREPSGFQRRWWR